MNFFSDETVFNVLSLADEYQVELQIKRCIEYLSKKCNDPNATLTEQVNILLCAERYSLKELYNACFDTVSKASPNLLKQVNEFVKLSEETREKFKRLRSQALDIKLTGKNIAFSIGVFESWENNLKKVDRKKKRLFKFHKATMAMATTEVTVQDRQICFRD